MVGMLGCGCCGPQELCEGDPNFLNAIVDDFSPTFDPYFKLFQGRVSFLQAINGICRPVPEEVGVNSRTSRGSLWGVFNKKTIEEPIEVSVKLIKWEDELYETPPTGIATEQIWLHVGIDLTTSDLTPWSFGSQYAAVARGYYFGGNKYQFRAGSFATLVPIRPKAGDVFGVRLSKFTTRLPFPDVPSYVLIKPTIAEFVLNGVARYTVTNTSYFTEFPACHFRTGMQMSQLAWLGYENFVYIEVDDWTHSSL